MQRQDPAQGRPPMVLTRAALGDFLAELEERGRAELTIRKYGSDLNRFYDFLGAERLVDAGTLPRWRESMIAAGYAGRSINSSMVVVNRLYDYLGCREWQCFDWLPQPRTCGPELCRADYLLLLEAARRRGSEQLYLLVRLLGCTDLTPGDLPLLTCEALAAGRVADKRRGAAALPGVLCRELARYAADRDIRTGPIFLGENGKTVDRTQVSKLVASLGAAAGLPPGVATPRNLRRLHLRTLSGFREEAERWVAQSYERLLETETAGKVTD